MEFGQPTNQDFSKTKFQSQIHDKHIGICHCKSAAEKTLPDDCNRCLKCGGMFDDVGTAKAEKRRKSYFDNMKQEQEKSFQAGRENEKRIEGGINWSTGGSSTSFSHQQHQQSSQGLAAVNLTHDINEAFKLNQDKLPKTTLVIGIPILVSGIGLLVYFLKKNHMKGNKYANN